jgi:CPA2 family monovalent cation:H+ antiporter-2
MIHDLAIIMITAGVISLLFKFLKQPVVLGYIIAGIVAGPYAFGDSWIGDIESVDTWGQVGVIFLLFALGLEFSFKKLIQMGTTALVSTLVIVVGMMTTGFLVGRALGWNDINSLFLGGMLSMSSTTIVFKALDDLGLRHQQFAKLCFSILIVEDLVAVVLMVLLASIAVHNTFAGGELLVQVAKLGAYLLIWFICGISLIPSLLKYCRRHLSDETLTILALGLCLGMVLLAEGAGFSAALGAFVMGSILAETVEAERIEHLVQPVKDVFGAIFFVSVGMMIDPHLLVQYWSPILLLTCVVICGQIVFATLGCLVAGQPLKVAMQSAFSLTQIGEFAFIIANFGDSLHVTESYLYPIVVAVSVITTFITPYMIRLSAPAYSFVDRHLSTAVKQRLEQYSQGRSIITLQSVWHRLLRKVLTTLVIYAVLTLFVLAIYFRYISTPVVEFISMGLPGWVGRLSSLLLVLVCITPFLYKMATKHVRCPEAVELWNMGHYNRGSLVGLTLLRIVLCIGVVIFTISRLFTLTYGVLAGISLGFILLMLYSKHVRHSSSQLEKRFLRNLSAREVAQDRARPIRRDFEQRLLSYDLHLADFEVASDSKYCGKMLMDLDLRRRIGLTIVRIVRGGFNVNIPGGRERLYPGDRIVVAGSDQQISDFQAMLDSAHRSQSKDRRPATRIPVTLEHFCVEADMELCGRTVAESHIREGASCCVLGVERDGQSLMNPDPSLRFEAGDVVILAGEAPQIAAFLAKVKTRNS